MPDTDRYSEMDGNVFHTQIEDELARPGRNVLVKVVQTSVVTEYIRIGLFWSTGKCCEARRKGDGRR